MNKHLIRILRRVSFLFLGGSLSISSLSMNAQNLESVILPKPASVNYTGGDYKIPSVVSIYAPESIVEANYFIKEIKDLCNQSAKIVEKKSNSNLSLMVDAETVKDKEGYRLIVDKAGIKIIGHDNAGVFYGLQSLLQLFHTSKNIKAIKSQLVEDAPAFLWRAYMLDEARHFQGEKEVYKILDEMAALKMNVLHWHLTDNEGWRIEIKKYPKFTEIGSKRKDTQIEDRKSEKTRGEAHSGYYSHEDVKRILKYAKDRHIRIIPEIEMPGHASAAVASYPWLGSRDTIIDVPIKFGAHLAVFNVADDRVTALLQDVVDEMLELFETDIIHIGGDEVRYNHWQTNVAINALKEERKLASYKDVQVDFTNSMSRYIQSGGARMMGWNEILGQGSEHKDGDVLSGHSNQRLAENVIVHFWQGNPDGVVKAAKAGYSIVNSYRKFTYLDYDYKSIPLEKAYSFEPIAANMPAEYKHKVLGVGCQMWTEWVSTPEILNYQTFPRIAAIAEVGWTKIGEKNFQNFLIRMGYFTERWDRKNINYGPLLTE